MADAAADTDTTTSSTTKKVLPQELLSVACRMAFLILEGILALSVDSLYKNNNNVVVSVDQLLQWLTVSVEQLEDPSPFKFL